MLIFVFRLVPRDSAKNRLRKKVSRSGSRKSAKRTSAKTRPAIKPDLFKQAPADTKPELPPKTKEKQAQLTSSDIWKIYTKPDILCGDEQQKPKLPPKHKSHARLGAQQHKPTTTTAQHVNTNNNNRTPQISAGIGIWCGEKHHTPTRGGIPVGKTLQAPDITRCTADLNNQLSKLKLISPISDV